MGDALERDERRRRVRGDRRGHRRIHAGRQGRDQIGVRDRDLAVSAAAIDRQRDGEVARLKGREGNVRRREIGSGGGRGMLRSGVWPRGAFRGEVARQGRDFRVGIRLSWGKRGIRVRVRLRARVCDLRAERTDPPDRLQPGNVGERDVDQAAREQRLDVPDAGVFDVERDVLRPGLRHRRLGVL